MLSGFYDGLIRGDLKALTALFPGIAALNVPRHGAIDGADALARFVVEEGERLRTMAAEVTFQGEMQDDGHVTAEFRLDLRKNGQRFDLPVAVVGQRTPGGFGQLRIYHSTWRTTGAHIVRSPVVWPRGRLSEPPVIRAYFDALAAGDAEAIMATFSPAGYLREPSGDQYRHVGAAERQAFYDRAFAEPGGVPLVHATAISDGRTCAVEYVCDRWGSARFAPMAGCAVYELDDAAMLIKAVRIYDDVTPPNE